MSKPATSAATQGDITFRPAYRDERNRAASLCTPGPARPGECEIHCFVAVKEAPVERLVGAAFWREVSGDPSEPSLAECEWNLVDACRGGEIEQAFLSALAAHVHQTHPSARVLRYSIWLQPANPQTRLLTRWGWETHLTRVTHRAEFASDRDATKNLSAPQPGEPTAIPAPIQPQHLEPLARLLFSERYAEENRSLRPSILAHGFHTASSASPALFDPRCSFVVPSSDGKGGETPELTGACLCEKRHDQVTLVALAAEDDDHFVALLSASLAAAMALGSGSITSIHYHSTILPSASGDTDSGLLARLQPFIPLKPIGQSVLLTCRL